MEIDNERKEKEMEREREKKLMDHFFKEDNETLSERIDESQKQLIEKDISFYALEAERPKGNLDTSLIDSDPFKPIHNILKGLSYILCFLVLLTGGVISKGTLFFMTSQIHPGTKHGYCSQTSGQNLEVTLSQNERISWIWAIFFCFLVPECMMLFRCIRICLFRAVYYPGKEFIFLALFETLHIIGIALLVFYVLPNIEVLHGVMITNCVCLVPGVLNLFARNDTVFNSTMKRILDVFAVVGQLSGLILWSVLQHFRADASVDVATMTVLPIALVLTSMGWWENYADPASFIGPVAYLGRVKMIYRERDRRYFSYLFLTLWRVGVFLSCMTVIEHFVTGKPRDLFTLFYSGFDRHYNTISEVNLLPQSLRDAHAFSVLSKRVVQEQSIASWPYAAVYAFLVQGVATLACFSAAKFASKIRIQKFSMALPLNLIVPVSITLLLSFCKLKLNNTCLFHNTIPPYLYWNCPDGDYLIHFIGEQFGWMWVFWMLSQGWITVHNWTPSCVRMAVSERLFVHPYYSGLLIDQSIAMNRRRDDEDDSLTATKHHNDEDVEQPMRADVDKEPLLTDPDDDSVSRIYVCGTMWHEGEEEMKTFLKSIYRLDQDQGTRQNAFHPSIRTKNNRDSDYYQLEVHIFFDDAFNEEEVKESKSKEKSGANPNDNSNKQPSTEQDDKKKSKPDRELVNTWVKSFINCITAVSNEFYGEEKYSKPIIRPTPFGGRMEWTLPNNNKMVLHMKNQNKIRKKKRWSQVMYMYYLLGYKLNYLNKLEGMTKERLDIRKKNTYILALDGDIDFVPKAVLTLVECMKRNLQTAAACGRIHPVGPAGVMTWYQVFEYAIGHWLQKATEHTIGCVLCSPGCFSLFRASALMGVMGEDRSTNANIGVMGDDLSDNVNIGDTKIDGFKKGDARKDGVMATYATNSSQPLHYIQFDQGEDRWLCTLLLQQGYRIEYCAASDSYTHCPESFDVFYNQRRRWVPSTMANILDLLGSYKKTTSVNKNISMLFIIYQAMLMVGTILGPGTIFLMIVGSTSAAFHVGNTPSFIWNLVPILIFMILCMTVKSKTQILVAQIMSAVYAIIMMAVLVGTVLELSQDGWLSPSGIFLLMTAATFIISAIVHPQEFWCLPTGLIYYLTVPSMYLLLIIFSVSNMNDVSWGTRDTTTPAEKKAKEEKKTAEKKGNKSDMMKMAQESEGSIEFSLAGLFKIMCCVTAKPQQNNDQLLDISKSLAKLVERLDVIEQAVAQPVGGRRLSRIGSFSSGTSMDLASVYTKQTTAASQPNAVVAATSPDDGEKRDPLCNPYWIQDIELPFETKDVLTSSETLFWQKLIEKYLTPIEANEAREKKTAQELKDLRNQSVFTFFILNAIYVTVVFLLTLEKDKVFIRWPLQISYDIEYSYDPSLMTSTVVISKTFLQLEPIGLTLVFFFGTIQVIQFTAMLFHRIGTFMQIMSLTVFYWWWKPEKLNDVQVSHLIKNTAPVVPATRTQSMGSSVNYKPADDFDRKVKLFEQRSGPSRRLDLPRKSIKDFYKEANQIRRDSFSALVIDAESLQQRSPSVVKFNR